VPPWQIPFWWIGRFDALIVVTAREASVALSMRAA